MDFEEIFAKIQRLPTGLAVFALIVALLMLFIWLPWPIALALFIGVCILIPILRQKWIARRSYTSVYQPPAARQTPEATPYQRGYQPQQPTPPAAQLSTIWPISNVGATGGKIAYCWKFYPYPAPGFLLREGDLVNDIRSEHLPSHVSSVGNMRG